MKLYLQLVLEDTSDLMQKALQEQRLRRGGASETLESFQDPLKGPRHVAVRKSQVGGVRRSLEGAFRKVVDIVDGRKKTRAEAEAEANPRAVDFRELLSARSFHRRHQKVPRKSFEAKCSKKTSVTHRTRSMMSIPILHLKKPKARHRRSPILSDLGRLGRLGRLGLGLGRLGRWGAGAPTVPATASSVQPVQPAVQRGPRSPRSPASAAAGSGKSGKKH